MILACVVTPTAERDQELRGKVIRVRVSRNLPHVMTVELTGEPAALAAVARPPKHEPPHTRPARIAIDRSKLRALTQSTPGAEVSEGHARQTYFARRALQLTLLPARDRRVNGRPVF